MALIEVEQAEWEKLSNAAKSNADAKSLLDKLNGNPKARRQVLELLKEMNPNLSIPEIDAAKPIMERVEKVQKEFDEFKSGVEKEKQEALQKRAEEDAKQTITKGRKKLRDSGWTKEGIDGVEKLMEERGILDYEAAAALFEKEHPPEKAIEPSNYGSSWNMLSDNQEDDLIKQAVSLPKGVKQEKALKRWQDNEIRGFFNDLNQTKGRVRF